MGIFRVLGAAVRRGVGGGGSKTGQAWSLAATATQPVPAVSRPGEGIQLDLA